MRISIKATPEGVYDQDVYEDIVYVYEIDECLYLLYYMDWKGEFFTEINKAVFPFNIIIQVIQHTKAKTSLDRVVVKQLRNILGDKFIEYKPKNHATPH